MDRVPILRKTLRDLRWHILGWGAALGILAALMVLIYPSYSAQLGDFELPGLYEDLFGEAARDFSNPRNFIQLEYYSWTPVLLGIYAIIVSTGLIAGEEQAGTLELLLAQPLRRRRLMLERYAGFALASLGIFALAALGFLLTAPFVDLKGEVGALELGAAAFSPLPFVLAWGALGLLAGALAPTRGLAAGLLTATMVVAYFAEAFANLVSVLDRARYLTPFYYVDSEVVLTGSVVWWHQALLLASAVVLLALALRAFERREVGTGRSPLAGLLRRGGRGKEEREALPATG